MKLLKFILIFCGLSVCLTTQPKGYLEQGSAWMEVWINTQNEPCKVFETGYAVEKEITIEGKNYLELRDGRGMSVGGIREEEGKLYAWLEAHEEDATDFLLCDFTAEAGDVIESNCPVGLLRNPVTIMKTDSISLLNGEKRKRLFTDKGTEWIEGIGSTGGIISEAIPLMTNFVVPYLSHFWKNEHTLVYKNYESLPICQMDDNQDIRTSPEIQLYPNPTTGIINIQLPREFSRNWSPVKIYSQEGNYIQELNLLIENDAATLDISYLQPGIYYVELKYKDLKQTYKIIKL